MKDDNSNVKWKSVAEQITYRDDEVEDEEMKDQNKDQ